MNIKNHSDSNYIFLLSGLLFAWIVVSEFILFPNNILPKPSIVLLSIISLIRDYQALANIFSSISAIYLSSIVAGFVIWIFRNYLFSKKKLLGYIASFLNWISGIVPGILLGLFLILWLPDSEISKYIFIFFSSFINLYCKAEEELKKVNRELIEAIASLGAGNEFIFNKICWKSIEPAIAESLVSLHFHLWSVLIVFEFIKGGSGLGSLIRLAVLFKDLAGLFASILLISVLILIGTSIIKYFKDKIFFWSIS
jgi:ABC-type nitrate/sulfonate/bicarbonate transport system permease component